MKQFSLFVLFTNILIAQTSFHNFGNIQVHENGQVGFHLNLSNDGTFDQNTGLVGFYNEDTLTISGAFSPVFYDMEIVVNNGLFLNTTVNIINNNNFIVGNIYTPKEQIDVGLNFLNEAFYIGESNITLINGYGHITGKESFTFPVGDDNRLRTLTINSTKVNALAKCAYFYEDPNFPSIFNSVFDTDSKDLDIFSVSAIEFWKLEGEIPSTVTLTWDSFSNINLLGEFITELTVVGWSKTEAQWINLGGSEVKGELMFGSITSETFIPNDFEIITIGGSNDIFEPKTIELANYFMTPNGDNKNDFLVIDAIEESPNNTLQIYNRYGLLVYQKENYNNEFNGVADRGIIINKNSGLPSGIYFYIISLNDLKLKHQGYLYISR